MTGLWKRWMQVWCWATVALGLAFLGAAAPPADSAARLFYDIVYWPLDGASPFGEQVRFTASILGAVMIGWAIAIFGLVEAGEALGARAWGWLTASLTVWWLIDSAASVASGVAMNAVSNTFFYATFLVPIVASGVLSARPAPRPGLA